MKHRAAVALLSLLASGIALFAPNVGNAAVVGDYMLGCPAATVSPTPIEAAGHTRVEISTLDAASLAPLDGLLIRRCGNPGPIDSPALTAAVGNGLRVMIDSQYAFPTSGLPGVPALVNANTQCWWGFPVAGSPIASGPGGTLNQNSLPNAEICSVMNSVTPASLPIDSIPFVLTSSQQVAAFAYPYGQGWVALSWSQWYAPLTYSQYANGGLAPGARTYYSNTLSWLLNRTTCATEGYTSTKMEWCKNICERGYTGATLDIWIHRWINRYRDLPYCALDDEEGEGAPTLK